MVVSVRLNNGAFALGHAETHLILYQRIDYTNIVKLKYKLHLYLCIMHVMQVLLICYYINSKRISNQIRQYKRAPTPLHLRR